MNRYSAYLRIRHPAIDPAEITRTLLINPAHAWAAGSARPPAGDVVPRRARPETYWLAPLVFGPLEPLDPTGSGKTLGAAVPLQGFLMAQVRRLAPHQGFFARIVHDGGSCDLMLSLSLSGEFGLELPPALLRSTADLNLTLSIEFAGDSETGAEADPDADPNGDH